MTRRQQSSGPARKASRRPAGGPQNAPAGVLPNRAVVAVIVAVVVAFAVVVTLAVQRSGSAAEQQAAAPGAASELLVRDSSHRLSEAADGKATFVEFLDFECEACGAAYPVIEQLRQQYAGRVTFVIRYFPLDGHFNAMRAARAVEAAAQQGQLEAMYKKMYATQQQWGEQQVPADATFRGFADELGLDMTRWDAAYNDNATLDRINVDIADGRALGVQSTPSFFVNGERLEPKSVDDLTGALDAALSR